MIWNQSKLTIYRKKTHQIGIIGVLQIQESFLLLILKQETKSIKIAMILFSFQREHSAKRVGWAFQKLAECHHKTFFMATLQFSFARGTFTTLRMRAPPRDRQILSRRRQMALGSIPLSRCLLETLSQLCGRK